MSVYIFGMEMPKNCMLCSFCVEEADPANGEMCMVTGKLMPPCNRERLDDCPLVPVPPHGDLIERKAVCLTDFEIAMCDGDYKEGMKMLLEKTESAPTIIPAEEGE